MECLCLLRESAAATPLAEPAALPAEPAALPAEPAALPAEPAALLAEAAALLGDSRTLGYRPCFARAFGGAACAVLLSQFWFWTRMPSGLSRERDGWFWKSQREITEETGLSRTETETARRKLCALGVLQEDVRGIPATLHYRLDLVALTQRLRRASEPPASPAQAAPSFARSRQTCLRKPGKPVCGNPANLSAEKPQTISEKTPEKTQKNIRSPTRPVLPAAWEKIVLPDIRIPNIRIPEIRISDVRIPDVRIPDVRIPEIQRQVNRHGTALLKAAIQQAAQQAAQRRPP